MNVLSPPETATEPVLAPPLKDADLEDVIRLAEQEVISLRIQRQRQSVNLLRRLPNAPEEYAAIEERLESAERTLAVAKDARLALADLAAEEAAELDAAAIRVLEEKRVALAKKLGDRLSTVERAVQGLAGTVGTALATSDELYNVGVALGIHGKSSATRDAIETRVSHVLRMANLPAFDLGVGPAARQPLGNIQDSERYVMPFPELPRPLPDRRDTHDVPPDAYPGAQPNQYPIATTELRDPVTGVWVSVPPGSIDFPPGHVYGAGLAPPPPYDLHTPVELEAEADERRKRHRHQDAARREAARTLPLLEGEIRRDG